MYDIAFTAQTFKIRDIVALVQKYRDGIVKHSLVATLDTGLALNSAAGIDLKLLRDGDDGGYMQMADLVENGKIRMVIFLHDPKLGLDNPGIMKLLRACNRQDIPFANNMTTAEFIIYRFLEREMSHYWQGPALRLGRSYVYAR